jgi:hypothetical protein
MLAWLLAQVVQGRLRRRELGGLGRAIERTASDFSFEAGAVAGGEHECVRRKALRLPR